MQELKVVNPVGSEGTKQWTNPYTSRWVCKLVSAIYPPHWKTFAGIYPPISGKRPASVPERRCCREGRRYFADIPFKMVWRWKQINTISYSFHTFAHLAIQFRCYPREWMVPDQLPRVGSLAFAQKDRSEKSSLQKSEFQRAPVKPVPLIWNLNIAQLVGTTPPGGNSSTWSSCLIGQASSGFDVVVDQV